MIKPFCIQVSLLIETEEENAFVPFFIQVEQIQATYEAYKAYLTFLKK